MLVAASDYVKALPDAIDRWMPRRLTSLGTDGFGRSEGRAALRDHFEVDAKHIVVATLSALAHEGKVDRGRRAEGDQGPGDQSGEAESCHRVGLRPRPVSRTSVRL